MGKSHKDSAKNREPNKNHPHKSSKFYKDEFHERKGKPFKGKRKERDIDGFDLIP